MCPSIIKFIDFYETCLNSKQPKCKSYQYVKKKAIAYPLFLAKLHFFSFAASILKPYLLIYQSERLLISFTLEHLHKLEI